MRSYWMVGALGVALASCATLNEQECRIADWRAVGHADGANGYAADRFSRHQKACAKHGLSSDFELYQIGRDEGLLQYCRPSRGFNVGVNGGNYNGVCPPHTEGAFLDAYNAGLRIYNVERDMRHAEGELDRLHDRIDELGHDLDHAEARLVEDGLSRQERQEILDDVKYLSAEIGAASERIAELEFERGRLAADLDRLRASGGYDY